MRIIYEPRGRAAEYAPLAVSLYRGCPHGCVYCFAPDSTRTLREDFLKPRARKDALKLLELDCKELAAAGDQREILMSFTTDPYQPLDEELQLTRKAIEILIRYNLHFTVLTKGGKRSERDFDLLASRPDLCRYGTTLVFADGNDRALWEPAAASMEERVRALLRAKMLGIRTWVSLEPVVYPKQTLFIIRNTCQYVDEYRIGKFNHIDDPGIQHFMDSIGYKYPTDQEWRDFVQAAKVLLDQSGSRYIFKKDLQPYLQQIAGV